MRQKKYLYHINYIYYLYYILVSMLVPKSSPSRWGWSLFVRGSLFAYTVQLQPKHI